MERTKESLINSALISFSDYLNDNYNRPEFFVSGSVALREAGFPLNREPEDIDVFIRLEDKTKPLYEKIRLMHIANYTPGDLRNRYPADSSPFTFTWQGVKINVWFYTKIELNGIFRGFHGIRFCGVKSVLHAKALYGRSKDAEDMLDLISSIREELDIAVRKLRKKEK